MDQDKNKNSLTQDNLDEFDLGLDNLDEFYNDQAPQTSQQTLSDDQDDIQDEAQTVQAQPLDSLDDSDSTSKVLGSEEPENLEQVPEKTSDNLDFGKLEEEKKDIKEITQEEDKKEQTEEQEKSLVLPMSKVKIIKKLLENIRENSRQLENLLAGLDVQDEYRIRVSQIEEDSEPVAGTGRERIIEGVFDGEHMVGPDGKQYTVPANYASKSKLVEGDMMKLTITANGTFLYKQIGPVERRRLVGTLDKDENGNYIAVVDGKKWRVLTASVTYFRGEVGDEVVILVPRSGGSRWAAVENIVKKS
jgi:hypothetical protein